MPYNDDKMTYDKTKHRYVLTTGAAGDFINLAEIYKDGIEIQRALNMTSLLVYRYIYTNTNVTNKDYIEHKLACDDSIRDTIFNAMLAQILADAQTGANDVINQVGINFNNGQVIEDRHIANRSLCRGARDAIESCMFNLLYLGDYGVRLPTDKYARWDY